MMLSIAVRELIIAAAEASAEAYVEEFAEPLDPNATNWDSVAWQEDRRDIPEHEQWTGGEDVEAWALYETTLVAKTKDLCA